MRGSGLDLSKLISDEPVFSIETERLGRVKVLPLTGSRTKALISTDEASPAQFVVSLLVATGRKEDGSEIGEIEAWDLTDAERNEFAEEFLEHNQYLFRKQALKRRQNDDGETVVFSEDGGIEHARSDGETASEYLLRVFKLYQQKMSEQLRKLMLPYDRLFKEHQSLFTPSVTDAFRDSRASGARLEDMINGLRASQPNVTSSSAAEWLKESGAQPSFASFQPPPHLDLKPAPNPVHETNKRLLAVVSRLDQMNGLAIQTAETVSAVSKSASEFLVAFGVASDKADTSSRRAIKMAAGAILVAIFSTLIQIGYAEWRAHQNQLSTDRAIAALFRHMDEMAQAQSSSTQQMSDRMAKDSQAVADSLDRLSGAISALSKSLRAQNGPAGGASAQPKASQ